MNSSIPNKKIRVAWFASAFVGRTASGTAQTARKLVIHLLQDFSDEVEVILLTKNEYEVELLKKDKCFNRAQIMEMPNVVGKWMKSSRQFYKFCLINRSVEINILHYSVPRVYPFFWLFPAKKIVCTFHAGGDVTVPRDFFTASREIYNFIVKKQWRNFDAIVADSTFASNEISQAYRIPKEFITTIYLGADNLWGVVEEDFERDLNLVLVMGRWQYYKNLHTVINAFKKFEVLHNKGLRLKVIGKSGLINKDLREEALNGFPKNQIELIEYLSDEELAKEYRKATVVFHPSINEGFGLPAFEAFGEGARLVVHKGTPADEILSSQIGVSSNNLLDEQKVIESYRTILTQGFGDIKNRRNFIKSIDATWMQVAAKYVSLYKEVLKR
jgi:glycosyltransferase involved in cell wall biosynthesis